MGYSATTHTTFKGKNPVKEEGVKEVAKDMLRPAYQDIRFCYTSKERKRNTKDKKEDCKIVWKSSMPWNQADYKVQLKKGLEDIRQKLCQVLGIELAKKEHSNMEATSPVNCLEEDVSVDLCEQRSGERGSGCNAPEEIYKSPKLANVSCKSSDGFPTPVTSPLMPPKPARTGRKQYSWRNSSKKEACMHIHIFNPLEFRNEREMQRSDERGSGCDAPAKIPGRPTSSDEAWESAEGLHTPVIPSIRPPKTRKRRYSWRNSSKREICGRIRIFNPLELRNNKEKKSICENKKSTNCQHRTDDDGMITSSNNDVTIREAVWHADEK